MNEGQTVIIGALMLLLGACAQLGIEPAQTFNQRVAYGYGTVKAVADAAVKLVKEKRMSVAEGHDVLAMVNGAMAYLNLAAETGDSEVGLSQLQLANQVLLEVQRYLEKKAKEAE